MQSSGKLDEMHTTVIQHSFQLRQQNYHTGGYAIFIHIRIGYYAMLSILLLRKTLVIIAVSGIVILLVEHSKTDKTRVFYPSDM